MYKLEIDDTRLSAVLTGLLLSSAQKSQLFEEIGINLVENARLRFSEGVSPDGIKWPISVRVKLFGGQTMLDKGLLRNSLSHNVLPDGVEYGTGIRNNGIPYGKVLQNGAIIKPVTTQWLTYKIGNRTIKSKQSIIPARPFVGISEDDKLMILDVVNSFLQRQAK